MTLANAFKTVLLLGILTALLLFIGSFFGKTGLTIAIIIAVLINFGSFFFGHKFILMIYRAKEAKESEYPELHNMVREVSRKAGLPKPKVYIVPSDNPNAFATGPTYSKGIVAYTTGIMKLLTPEELKGVTAHELSHIKNRDTLIATIAATIAGVISYLATMAQFSAIFGGGNDENRGGMIEMLILALLTPIIATLLQLAISRSREFHADATGAHTIRTGEPLARALEKLERGSQHNPIEHGTQATHSLFIVNPLSGRKIINLLSTHPSTEERAARLRAMKF